jgi:Flp pilus assembly protein TadG
MHMKSLVPTAMAFWRRLRDNRRGNVLMILGFSIIPLTLATGMAVDYARAARLQTKLNAAADAAALLAVSKQMMLQTNDTAQTAAQNFFDSQATGQVGLLNTSRTVTITGGVGASNTRTAVVTYTANSKNAFSGVLGMSSVGIGGTSTATSSQAPNIDFYVMIDTSPSMLLPATTADLATMTTATSGCAFACHQTNTTSTDPGHTTQVSGHYQDYYQVARNHSLTLRTDLVTEAVQNLTDVATSTASSNGAHYRMGLYQFDYRYQKVWPTTSATVDSSLSTVKTHVTDAQILTYCINNQRVCGTGDNDTATNFTAAFTGALGSMPTTPGQGTNVSGDTPMALLFIVTDGMRDEASGGSRFMGPIPTSQCDTIKARGIRIAVLHTEYLAASASDSWSINNVRNPYLSPTDNISPALISCASPGLYYQVTTDDDITAALAALFQRAVATAHLIQ